MSKALGNAKVSTHFEGCEDVHPECKSVQDNRQDVSSSTNGWIPCEVRLPVNAGHMDKSDVVLTTNGDRIEFGWYDHFIEGWVSDIRDITHWMPLPPAPEVE